MGYRYLFVDPARQPSPMACLATAVNMLQRWQLNRQGVRSPTVFENVVGSGGGKDISGVNVNKAITFVREQRWSSLVVSATPSVFEEQLRKHGPFIYIERVGLNALPTGMLLEALNGASFLHADLITGISSGTPHIFYNDPGEGRSRSMSFAQFLSAHPPFRDANHTLIIFIP